MQSWQLRQESVSLKATIQTAAKLPPKEDISTLLQSPLKTGGLHSFDWLHADGQMVCPIARTLLFSKGLPFTKKSSLGKLFRWLCVTNHLVCQPLMSPHSVTPIIV